MLANTGVTFQKWVKCCRAKRTCICTCTISPRRESNGTLGWWSGPSKARSLIQRLSESLLLPRKLLLLHHQHPLHPPLVPQPHPLGLRLCSVLVKNKCLWEEVNTFLLSVIYTLVWRSKQQFPSWDQDLKGGQGENEAVWWGRWGCTADGWQVGGRDRRWGRGTEDKLRLLVKTPDFGTMVRQQFWATRREPGFL